jgi:excisionase family DNA binding protein
LRRNRALTTFNHEWISIATAARILGCSRWTVRRLALAGMLPVARPGRDLLVWHRAVEELAVDRAVGG